MVGAKMTIANNAFTMYSNGHLATILDIAIPHGYVMCISLRLNSAEKRQSVKFRDTYCRPAIIL